MAKTTSQNQTKRRTSAVRACAQEAMPAYGVADGAQSWRYGLRARERATVDRALAILGRHLRALGDVFDCPDTVRDYLALRLGADPCERFAVLYLDNQHRAIAYECHFTGSLTQTSVHPREIAVAALKHGAAAVVLAHNHPSGALRPSRADEMLTNTLKGALALVEVRVLDHIIVSGKGSYSMAEHGLM